MFSAFGLDLANLFSIHFFLMLEMFSGQLFKQSSIPNFWTFLCWVNFAKAICKLLKDGLNCPKKRYDTLKNKKSNAQDYLNAARGQNIRQNIMVCSAAMTWYYTVYVLHLWCKNSQGWKKKLHSFLFAFGLQERRKV